MADTTVDKVKIEIEASAKKAEDSIDKLIENLSKLREATGNIDTRKLYELSGAITSLAEGMKNMPKASAFTNLAKGIERLNGINTTGLNTLTESIENLTNAKPESLEDLAVGILDLSESMRGIPSVNSFEKLADGLNRLNGIDTSNIRNISNSINELAESVSALNNSGISDVRFNVSDRGVVSAADETARAQEQLVNVNEDVQQSMEQTTDSAQEESQAEEQLGQNSLSLAERLRNMLTQAKAVRERMKSLANTVREAASSGFGKLQSAISNINSTFSKASGTIANFNRKLAGITNKLSSLIKNSTHANAFIDKLKNSFSGLTKIAEPLIKKLGKINRLMVFMALRKAITAMFTNLGTAFQHLAQKSSDFNDKVSDLISTCNLFCHQVAAMTQPLIDMFGPALTYIVNLLAKATSYINQFLSALTGKNTFTSAKKVQTDYAASLDKTTKKVKAATAGIDELNIISQNDSSSSNGNDNNDLEDCYEELEIEQEVLDLADKAKDKFSKLKDILSQLFAPLKKAWDEEGQYVIDSWKYALNEVWELIKAIGRDFLTVWNEPETLIMLEEILHIIGDIGLIVGNLAHNFRLAWEENKTGLHILENIRDILAVIIHNIHVAAEATVKWSEDLDFRPLLTKIEEWTASLVPVFDTLSGIISDFYITVLLPLGKWVLEKGLPELLQVFIDFNNKVDWEKLRSNLQTLWEHLEPFAETVGEGLILFIQRVSDALANFVNSEGFQNFLTAIENWMDSVDAEDVANALENVAKAIIAIKLSVLAFKAGSTVATTLETLVSNLTLLSTIGVIAATVYVGIEFSKDYKEWKNNIDEYGWDKGRKKTADENTANPYKNGTAFTQDDGSGILDQWSKSISDWQEKNKSARDSEKQEWNNWYDNTATTVSEWWQTKIQPWFTTEKWQGIYENVNTATSTKWEEIKTSLSTKWDEIKGNSTEKFDAIKSNISTKWEDIKSKTTDTWEGVKTTISEKTAGCEEPVKKWSTNVKNWFTGGDGNGNIVEKFKGYAGDMVTGFKDKIGNTYTTVKDNVTTWATSVKDWFYGTGTTLKDKFIEYGGNIISGFKDKVGNTYTTVKDNIIAWASKVKSWFTDDGGVNSTKFETFASNIINGFKNKIGSYYTTVQSNVQTWASKVVSWFEEKCGKSDFETLATNVVDGFKNKIGSLYSTCKDTIQSWGSDIISWFKERLDINSPSKEFAKLAEYTVEGFANGISGSDDNVVKGPISAFAENIKVWFTGSSFGDINGTKWSTYAEDVINGFGAKIGNSYTNIQDNMTTWAAKTKEWFTDSGFGGINSTNFDTYAANIIDGFKTKIGNYYSTSQSNMITWANKVREWYTSSSFGGVNSTNFATYAANVVDGFKTKIGSYYTTCRANMTTWANDIKNTFANPNGASLVDSFKTIGSNIIQGFIEGVGSLWESATAKIREFGASVIAAGKEGTQERSPSRAFRKIGAFVVEGFNLGLDDEADSTLTHMRDWISRFSDITVELGTKFNVSPSDYTANLDSGFTNDMLVQTVRETVNTDSMVKLEFDSNTGLKNMLKEIAGEEFRPILESIEVSAKKQADKKETTTVYVGNREVAKSVEEQKNANGFSFTPIMT